MIKFQKLQTILCQAENKYNDFLMNQMKILYEHTNKSKLTLKQLQTPEPVEKTKKHLICIFLYSIILTFILGGKK